MDKAISYVFTGAQKDEEINDPTSYEHRIIWLRSNLVVNSILNLDNVTLIIESPSDGGLEIIVNGELNVKRSTIKAADPEYGYRFTYRAGSKGKVQDSTIEDIGAYSPTQLNPGLLIQSPGIVVERNTFRHCRGTSIQGSASNLRIVNNLFEETRQGGIQIGAPDVYCSDVTVANNTFIKMGKLGHPSYEICCAGSDDGIGIDFQNSNGKIFGNFLIEGRCSAIEIEKGSKVDICDNVITNNLDWAMNIHDSGTRVLINNNTIEDIILRPAIWIYNGAFARIGNNIIKNATPDPIHTSPNGSAEFFGVRALISVSLSEVLLGETVTVSGSIIPLHIEAMVTLIYEMPNGIILIRNVTSTAFGEFEDIFTPEIAGSWTVKANWGGDLDHEGVESPEVSFTVEKVEVPAKFTVTDLSMSPTEAEVKQKITISVKVTNVGEQTGSYTVDLKVNGVVVDTKTVALTGGESTTVMFELVKEEARIYDIEVSGLKGTLSVKEITPPPPPWKLYIAITACIVIVTIVVTTIIFREMKTST